MKGHVGRLAILAAYLSTVIAAALITTVNASAAAKVPYSDPNSVGSIGLCNQQGQQLTNGSVDTRPFVWKAVDQTAAPAPYNSSTATATLYAYQPRPGVDAGDWSGAQLDIASKFADPSHPATALTGLDQSLAVFVADYPPEWNGFIQLRMYLNAPDQPTYNSTYDSANIQVSGNTWSVVGGITVECTAGQAQSLRQVVATNTAAVASLSAQTTEGATPPARVAAAKPSNGTAGASAGGQAAGSSSATSEVSSAAVAGSSALAAAGGTSTLATTGHSGGSSDTLLWVLVAVGVVGAGVIGVQWLRSRS